MVVNINHLMALRSGGGRRFTRIFTREKLALLLLIRV